VTEKGRAVALGICGGGDCTLGGQLRIQIHQERRVGDPLDALEVLELAILVLRKPWGKAVAVDIRVWLLDVR
jgi:hypothetical protein